MLSDRHEPLSMSAILLLIFNALACAGQPSGNEDANEPVAEQALSAPVPATSASEKAPGFSGGAGLRSAVPRSPLQVKIDLPEGDGQKATPHIDIALKNVTAYPVRVRTAVSCHGLSTETGAKQFGDVRLTPNEEATVRIPANQLPVQSLATTLQLVPELHVTLERPTGTRESRMLLHPISFQHRDDYQQLVVFDDAHHPQATGGAKKLRETLAAGRGNFSSKPRSTAQRVVGRVMQRDGSMKEEFDDDEKLAVMDEGKLIGYLPYRGTIVGRD